MPNFAKIYSKFRGSTWFLAILLGTVVLWFLAHGYLGFDKDLGLLNIFLSFEASVSLAFFTMVSDFQNAETKKQTDAMESILHRMEAHDQALLAKVDDILEEVEEDGN